MNETVASLALRLVTQEWNDGDTIAPVKGRRQGPHLAEHNPDQNGWCRCAECAGRALGFPTSEVMRRIDRNRMLGVRRGLLS